MRMCFKVLCIIGIVLPVISSAAVDFKNLRCKGQDPPLHGSLTCTEDDDQRVSCELSCDPGYDVEFLAAERYVCNTDGTWTAEPFSTGTKWPNCKHFGRGEPIP